MRQFLYFQGLKKLVFIVLRFFDGWTFTFRKSNILYLIDDNTLLLVFMNMILHSDLKLKNCFIIGTDPSTHWRFTQNSTPSYWHANASYPITWVKNLNLWQITLSQRSQFTCICIETLRIIITAWTMRMLFWVMFTMIITVIFMFFIQIWLLVIYCYN